MKVILDTNVYLSQGFDFFAKNKNKIVGTKWNAWELITSSRYNRMSFQTFQRAICKFLKYCDTYLKYTPVEGLMGDHLGHLRITKSRKVFDIILDELLRIESAADYDAYLNGQAFVDFREYDNRARNSMTQLIANLVKKLKRHNPKVFDRQLAYYYIAANMDEFVLDWLWKHYRLIPMRSKIETFAGTPFIELFLDYAEMKFNQGGCAHRNDFNDLVFSVYLNNSDFAFCTTEPKWEGTLPK